MSAPLIQFENVHKAFGDNVVLKDVNLSIHNGQITTIIGKSGTGKSVLIKHIIGLLTPDAGKILLEGRPLHQLSKRERRALRRRVSYMFQNCALFDSMTIFENIALPLNENTVLPTAEINRRVRDKMHQLDLANTEAEYPSQLSGGMQKRVALARALVTDPEIVLFDEPTTGLDPIRKNAVHSMIADYQSKLGFTAIVVSHEIPDVFYISQRIAMLNDGHIIFEGTPHEIQRTKEDAIQQFIQGKDSGHDSLTGMAPQIQGELKFEEEMARLQRHHIPFSLVLLTVNDMADINARFGHITGQTLIQNFAIQVQKNLYITDTSVRIGMNKIMVVLPDTDTGQAEAFCDRLSKRLQENSLLDDVPHPDFCFQVDAGFVQVAKNSSLQDVIARAEDNQSIFFDFSVCQI